MRKSTRSQTAKILFEQLRFGEFVFTTGRRSIGEHPADDQSGFLKASRNIGKKLRCDLSFSTLFIAMVFALRRSPPIGVITSMSGFFDDRGMDVVSMRRRRVVDALVERGDAHHVTKFGN